MLRSMKECEGYAVSATDGQIGHVKDLYFDDDAWAVRYVVVETGSWLASRKVLITPISIARASWVNQTLAVSITRSQVRESPDVDTDKPVSRQNEEQFLGYYGYPNYWGGAGMWGGGMYPDALFPGFGVSGVDRVDRVEREREVEVQLHKERARHRNDDPHLRSCKAVIGYHLAASDGEIGHVADYLIDDETWAIRYLVVDTSNWWLGHEVLIAPEWVSGVHWSDSTVSVGMKRDMVKSAPPYQAGVLWDRESEVSLYRHHGRSAYWSDL